MDISDIYLSIGQKRNISHFANIVRIAKSDQEISAEEVEMLSRIAKKYNITNDRFKQILREPERIPTLAHLECEERVERLYELLEMVEIDRKIEIREVNMLRKIVTGLAFPCMQWTRSSITPSQRISKRRTWKSSNPACTICSI